MQEKVCAVILAAGESRRMGTPKMVLPFKGTTILEQVILNVRNSGAGNIMVVLGAWRGNIEKILSKSEVDLCFNRNFSSGMLSSVLCGLDNTHGSFMVIPGDQPLISSESINMVIEKFRTSGKGIIVAVYNGKRGHPVLIHEKYRKEIKNIDAAKGLRELLVLHAGDVLEVDTGDPGVLKDFDTYEEYLNEMNQIS
jgi:molybdenum cofactor cytidylyltransferase